jgi:hypothetical protein
MKGKNSCGVVLLLMFFSAVCTGQVTDLKQLVGRKAVVQRTILYKPSSFTQISTDYAGQEVTIIGFKPFAMPAVLQTLSPQVMARMPPQSRAAFEDMRNSGSIRVRFADGTEGETPTVMPSMLANYLEVTASATPVPPVADASTAPVSAVAAVSHATPDSADVSLPFFANGASSTAPSVPALSLAPVAPAIPVAPMFPTLSETDVRQALAGKGRDHWVKLTDVGHTVGLSLLLAMDSKYSSIVQNATMTIYMPEALLAIRQESAKRQFLKYQPTDDDMRQAIMVVAEGFAAGISGGPLSTSITRVVLVSDPSGKVVEEAYLSEPLGESWQNGFGATSHGQSLRVRFSMDSVQRVKAAAPNGEFIVAVFAGETRLKMYVVKEKFQKKLGL